MRNLIWNATRMRNAILNAIWRDELPAASWQVYSTQCLKIWYQYMIRYDNIYIYIEIYVNLITCCLMTSVQYSVFELHSSMCSPQSPHVCCSKKTNCKKKHKMRTHLEDGPSMTKTIFMISSPIPCTCSRWGTAQGGEEQKDRQWQSDYFEPTLQFLNFQFSGQFYCKFTPPFSVVSIK